MKKFILFTTALLVLGSGSLFAQNKHFTTNGIIEYEKSVNMYAVFQKIIDKDNEAWLQPAFDSYKKTQPQFRKLKSTLAFGNNKTMFTPIEPETQGNTFFLDNPMVGQNNTVQTDLNTNTSVVQKKVFESVFLVKDSVRKINWKITTETREIAGFTCRRANALVLDSVYVVAFYADDIAVSGGPESFAGLPGMILGLAIPHENVTWFATKVNEVPVDDKALAAPKKGKVVDRKGLTATLTDVMKNWGNQSNIYLKAFIL
jgi:GLPGLI family protein